MEKSVIVNPKMRRVVTKAPLKNAEMTLPNSCERNKRAQLIIFVCVVPATVVMLLLGWLRK